MMKQILIIVNDKLICKLIKYNLQDSYTNVYYAVDIKDGFKRYLEREYCLVIIEIDCRNNRLLEMLKYLREVKSVPILVYSLINSITNKTICLDLGADAWIAAPFRSVSYTHLTHYSSGSGSCLYIDPGRLWKFVNC